MAEPTLKPFDGQLDPVETSAVKPFTGTLDGETPGLAARVKQGASRAFDSARTALTDDPNKIAQIAAEQARTALPQSDVQRKMAEEFAPYVDEANKAEGVVDNVKAWGAAGLKRAGQLVSNPGETAKMIAEQLPNSLPGMAGGIAGAKLGAMAGTAVMPGVGTAIGGLAGGVLGGFAGGYGLEKGAAMQDQVQKEAQAQRIDLQDESAVARMVALKQPEFDAAAQRKGVGTAGTDALLSVATMGLAGVGGRPLAKEARTLVQAVKAGTISAADAAADVARLQAADAARNTLGAKALRGAGVVGAEMGGEGLSEGVGQKLAYGNVDAGEVIDESLMGLGTGGAMALGSKAFNKAAGIVDQDATTQNIAAASDGLGALGPAFTTAPGAVDPNAAQAPVAQAPEAPDLSTTLGAGVPRDGVPFTRDIDTSGLAVEDRGAMERARAAMVDYQPGDTTPQWETSMGATAARQGLDMPAPEFDTGTLGLESQGRALTPSERMGINPAAGALSRAAAVAVDSGATPVQFLGATGRDLQARTTGPGVTNESNVIDVQGRLVEDRAISTSRRLTDQQDGMAARAQGDRLAIQPPTASSAVPALGGPVGADAARGGTTAVSDGVADGRPGGGSAAGNGTGSAEAGAARAGGRGNSTPALSAPTNLREGLARMRARRQEAADAQTAAQSAPTSAPAVSTARPGAVEAAGLNRPKSTRKAAEFDARKAAEIEAGALGAQEAEAAGVPTQVTWLAHRKWVYSQAPRMTLREFQVALKGRHGMSGPEIEAYYKSSNGGAEVSAAKITTEGTANVPQADQAQQTATQPTQAGAAQPTQGLTNAATPQNNGAQAAPAPGAQAQAPGNANWAALTPEQRRRARLEHEIATGQTNNGGVVASLRPSAIEKRKQELAAMGDAGKLPSPGPAEPLSADGLAAQGQAAPGAQGAAQAAQAGVAPRPKNWRTSMLGAAPVAKAMGIDTKGKRPAQVVAEIDARDTQAPATPAPAPAPGPTRLGRDNTPLSDGGKPFKTRKAAGDAKKLQPMMRVVTVPGGYALAEKTPAQLAAEERAAKRLRTPRTSPAGEPVPAHAFIAASGGMHMRHRNDLGVDGNPRIGNRRLFGGLNRGLSIEQATEMLVADGYLSEGASHNDAYALIKKSLSQPQYNADGIERIAQAESDAQFEDYMAAQEEAAAEGDMDPFGMAGEFTSEELDDVGYASASPALQAEVNALIAQADAMDIDTYAILEDIARTYANATQDQYNAAARDALAAAIARSNQDGGSVAAQAAPAAEPAAEQELNRPAALTSKAQAATENVAPEALELAAQTPAEAAARQDAQEQADKAEAAAKRAEDAAAKAEEERKRIAQASVRAADRFELGQDPMDSLTGQGGLMFSRAPAGGQTETAAFKRWFGDSKVVDAQGNPLVVYHGTRREFTTFDYSKIGEQGRAEGAGFYFTNSEKVASGYGAAMEVFLSIKKPLAYDAKPFSTSVVQKIVARVAELEAQDEGGDIADGFLANFGDVRSEGLKLVIKTAADMIAADETALDQLSGIVGSGVRPQFVNQATRDVTGFDGVVANGFSNAGDAENRIYVAFFPEQIKSATGNNGQFDPSNPDIRFSFAGQQAATADTMALATAQQRLEAGEDAETVRQETGWHKGVDGKWRFEISDADARLKDRTQWTAKIDGINAKRDAALQALWQAKEQRNDFLRARGESPSRISSETKKTPEFKALAKALKNAEAAAEKAQDAAFLARQGDSLITVGDVLSHPALFAAYPGIADVRVDINDSLPAGNAAYAYELRAIELSGKSDAQQLLSTLLHEIQHGIQHIEGFAMGGSIESARAMQADAQSNAFNQAQGAWYESRTRWPSAYKALMDQRMLDGRLYDKYDIKTMDEDGNQRKSIVLAFELRKKISEADKALRSQAQLAYNDAVESELGGFGSDAFNEFNGLYSAVTKAFEGTAETATSVYKRLAGEVEARNTQARQGMTDEQRRATPPSQTADVADSRVIVMFNGKEMANAPMPANAAPDAATTAQPLRTPAATIRAAITKAYGKLLDQLESKGLVTLTQTEDEAIEAAAQARAAKTGQSVEQARSTLRASVKNSVADQTQTENFQRWFKDSKVVDAEGKPLVVYHGTTADFDAFDNAKTGANDRGLWGRGHYFSASVDNANSYALRQGDGARLIPAYVSIQNPLILKTGSDLVTRLPDGTNTRELIGPNLDGAKIKDIAMAGGHDGVIQLRPNGLIGDLVAYTPEQIKSATGNSGAFDPANPDIRRSADGSIQGFFDPQTGQSFLIADNLTAEAAPGVLMHEVGIHMAADGSMKALFNRAAMMLKLQRGNPFMKAVQDRMDAAGETSGEEAAAYIAEAYENDRANAPASVQRWLADLLAAVKAWMFKKGIMGADRLTVADIAAVARANARSMARDGGATGGQGFGTAFSRAPAGDQTQTEAFKRWFAGSRVVDADGKPLLVYHGTTKDFDAFDQDSVGDNFGRDNDGFFFTGSAVEASGYADPQSELLAAGRPDARRMTPLAQANVMPVYLSIKNPLTLERYTWAIASSPEVEIDESGVSLIDFFDSGNGDVTRYAKEKGHDGVLFQRGGETLAVAFFPEQIKSATGNRGTFDPTNPDIRFSRTTDAAKAVGDTLKSITVSNVKERAGFKLTDYRGIGLQFLGRRQLVDVYGGMLPEMRSYSDLMARMDADKNEAGSGADQLAQDWAKLPDERALAELMHDATLAQIDPSKDFVEGDNKLDWTRLKARYTALTPGAKDVFARARDTYRQHMRDVRSAIKERIERTEISSERKASMLKRMDDEFFGHIKGVYFPLARFGQYLVVVKDAEGKVANVSRAEGMGEADEMRRQLLAAFPAGKGFTVGKVLKAKDFVAERDSVGRGFMEQLYGVLDKQGMDTKQRAELEDALGQLYLSSLPDLSWAKHGIHRKGTAGFSQDARRAFAQNVFHGASYLAKLRYGDRLQDELGEMQRRVDAGATDSGFDSVKAQQVVDEMVKRHDAAMNPKTNAVSTALTSLGFMFHLGLSPASAMVNLTQTALVAYPVMGAKWGFGKASTALLKASGEAARGKNDITGSLSAEEKAAFDEAVRAGVIDVTMAHDLAGIAQGEDQNVSWKLRPAMRAASWLFHHAEKFNRQITFVAAYRLAREAGAGDKAAYEQAVQATYDGHFDYSSNNRPRVMQGNVARVVLLFKQYGQNMVYTLVRNAQQSLNGATPEERAQARKALGGLLAMHGLAAGALGLPMVTTLLAAASMLGGDDDEPWDAQVAIQNMLADAFGQKAAEVIAHGLSRLTPWDISGRVGLDKLIFPDLQEGLEGQRLGESAMAAALGPVAGIGINVLKGIQEMSEGRYLRGLETMAPSVARGPLKALRYGDEGVRDKTGIVVQDEVDAASLLGQAAGFSPSSVRNAFEGKSAIVQHDRALQARRSALVEQFAMAAMAGDEEGKAAAREDIAQFNKKNPNRRIQAMQLAQSVAQRQKRIREAQGGVYLPSKRRDAMEAGRFALGD